MWGGVKVRAHHGDIFRGWSAGQGLESLRRQLYREPRPWYIAWSLHHHKHLLSDHHCARLLAWCTTVMDLEKRQAAKRQAYMYSQQVFQVMVHSHKVGSETYQEFFRLCATGRDLTTAFRWQQYLVETGQPFPLSHYTWLLRVALLSPNDENAEDMAEAVWETYLARYCHLMKQEVTGDIATSHFQPSNEEETRELEGLFKAFKQLRSKIVHVAKPELLDFIDSLPGSSWNSATLDPWPTVSRHHTFSQLEAGVSWAPPTLSHPHLRDSLLHESFTNDLEKAAFLSDAQRVVTLVNEYLKRISVEKSGESGKKYRAGERDIWHRYSDPSVAAFRKPLVEAGGVTAELYHYLIVALSTTQPTLALRTLRRMEETNLRVLDLTRAVMIVRCEGSPADQQALLQEQLQEIALRQKINHDYDVTRDVELFWKFSYAEFFHYRNALSRTDLYRILIEGLGPVRVQELLTEAKANDSCSYEDVVVFDESFRAAAAAYFRGLCGQLDVNKAMDEIAAKMPKLDISLVGSMPHFSDYALPEGDFVATDISALRGKLVGFKRIYVLDSSFVETSEQFLTVGQTSNTEDTGPYLVLVPYCCLQQLASTIEQEQDIVTFDEALQEANKAEPFIASQRLRSLFALLRDMNKNRRTRVLHFSECLMAHSVESSQIKAAGLDPTSSDNDHLFLLIAMVRAIAPAESEVVLCTDDAALVKLFLDDKLTSFFVGKIFMLSSQPPQEVLDNGDGLIDDNPDLCVSMDFEPKLQAPAPFGRNHHGSEANTLLPSEAQEHEANADALGAAWLDMLDGQEQGEQHLDTANDTPHPQNGTSTWKVAREMGNAGAKEEGKDDDKDDDDDDLEARKHESLMNMYESEHAVVPVGALMAEASSLGSVFEQFDVLGPDAQMDCAVASPVPQQTTGQPNERPRKRSLLEAEARKNRGASNKQRFLLAKRLSNISGGRVPFNFRYRILDVNIRDPKNKPYEDAYKEGVAKKRESFKRNFSKSYLVGGGSP
ncbi:hypothetical protein TraAM80_03679 [Trypanosoma rangeli]|uniref:Uncharacterized protein n=1 Tax=Trypanosoma rangeli TaxID=5698 RepID=A0A422NNK4_TRYRA|nr:uncharacterized protein TraAM80_03679 [Trypanosoma rangeli]RNF07045.1 hypothetical protein TraAM80_03679 [Trypanosoma rangeli]|eukprot:RNF07045.1 hypothetical protein TraAM80_03679 [Trypanosoma rangeli]